MTEERIAYFLKCFYDVYIETCYKGFELVCEDEEIASKIENYDVKEYFSKHLEIYLANCDPEKDYAMLYNTKLFSASRAQDPEPFNTLGIYLIENFQLFLHTILEKALSKYLLEGKDLGGLKLIIKPIDNDTVKLVDLVDRAEAKMKADGIIPPAMG